MESNQSGLWLLSRQRSLFLSLSRGPLPLWGDQLSPLMWPLGGGGMVSHCSFLPSPPPFLSCCVFFSALVYFSPSNAVSRILYNVSQLLHVTIRLHHHVACRNCQGSQIGFIQSSFYFPPLVPIFNAPNSALHLPSSTDVAILWVFFFFKCISPCFYVIIVLFCGC